MVKKNGRPLGSTKYNEEFLDRLSIKLTEWIKIPSNWFLTDFAIENDIWEQRFVEFAARHECFSETLKKAKQIQTSRLVKLGLARKVDTGMAIFTLKNISGWRDMPIPKEDDELKDTTLRFSTVPDNGEIQERYGRFIN